jgi:hypothetical protein
MEPSMTITTTEDDRIIDAMLSQISRMTVLAVSGGRVRRTGPVTLTFEVGKGYRVEVEHDRGSDTYIVRRTFIRGQKRWIKGEVDYVHAEELDETVYLASCFVNIDFGDHKVSL